MDYHISPNQSLYNSKLSLAHRRVFPLSLFYLNSPSYGMINIPSFETSPEITPKKSAKPISVKRKKTRFPEINKKIKLKDLKNPVLNLRSLSRDLPKKAKNKEKIKKFSYEIKKNKQEVVEEARPVIKKMICSSQISTPAKCIGQMIERINDLIMEPLATEMSG